MLIPDVDTIFIMSDIKNIYVSSSGVKEAALLGGDISSLVPQPVNKKLIDKIKK